MFWTFKASKIIKILDKKSGVLCYDSVIFNLAVSLSFTADNNHSGLEVAPQIPMDDASFRDTVSDSSEVEMKWVFSLTSLAALNNTFPLELFLPLTKNTRSNPIEYVR